MSRPFAIPHRVRLSPEFDSVQQDSLNDARLLGLFPILSRCALGLPPYALMVSVIHTEAVLAFAWQFALSNSSVLCPATETTTTPTLS